MKNNFYQASVWALLSEILAKLITPLSFIILTHILLPEDFGIVAVATTILSYLYIVSDLGVSKIIIQEGDDSGIIDELSTSGFWINLFLATFLFLLIFFGAKKIALLLGVEEATSVIKVCSIQVVFFSLSSIQTARRKMRMEFKFLFKVRMITAFTPAFVSIIFAFCGFGYWAIVLGQVFSSILACFYLWQTSDWQPKFSFSFPLLKKILSKSIWSTLEQLIILVPVGLDTYLISKNLNTKSLGLYTTSRSLFTSVSSVTLAAIIPVLYSQLSGVKKDAKQFRKSVFESQKRLLAFSLFFGIIFFIFSSPIEKILFNEQWNGIGLYFGCLFLIMSLEYFASPIYEAIKAQGYFKLMAFTAFISTLLTIPILFIGIKWGLLWYIIIRASCLYLYFPFAFYFSKKKLNISFRECLKNNFILILSYIIIAATYIILNLFVLKKDNAFVSFALCLLFFMTICITLKDMIVELSKVIIKMLGLKKIALSMRRTYKNAQFKILPVSYIRKNRLACGINIEEKLHKGERVLCLVPHADDEYLGCLNLLENAMLSTVQLAYYGFTGREESDPQRDSEIKKLAKIKGFTLDILDNVYQKNEAYRLSWLKNQISNIKPTIILAPTYCDWHPEHRAVANDLYEIAKLDTEVDKKIFSYHISVPLAIGIQGIPVYYYGINKKSSLKKKREFLDFYPSQTAINTERFEYQHRINAKILCLQDYTAEIFWHGESYVNIMRNLHEIQLKVLDNLFYNINKTIRIRIEIKDIIEKYHKIQRRTLSSKKGGKQ
ncbi:hypothetical protein HQ47_10280 [Porphyromonas macacae]|uniref:Uncharacterized protein n=1 Tax=Porphyromonas macacae TaxID=28115 RepID=A0A0A2E4F3_9PORP|nr:oligosaccharide flippase family protein [Porphyromonas macacae]KGN72320.1 hypothetical protein HQ47_10280 [Porphyromonas macacae]